MIGVLRSCAVVIAVCLAVTTAAEPTAADDASAAQPVGSLAAPISVSFQHVHPFRAPSRQVTAAGARARSSTWTLSTTTVTR
jgi:hypothetical protein